MLFRSVAGRRDRGMLPTDRRLVDDQIAGGVTPDGDASTGQGDPFARTRSRKQDEKSHEAMIRKMTDFESGERPAAAIARPAILE